jgi:hypothetical protein
MKPVALALCLAAFTFAQTPDSPQKETCEVASIHAAKQDGSVDIDSVKGSFLAHNVTMRRLAALAYEPDMRQISGGPGFVDWESHDINAKPEASPGDRPSILTALEEQLGLNRESLRVPFSAVVIDRAESPEEN